MGIKRLQHTQRCSIALYRFVSPAGEPDLIPAVLAKTLRGLGGEGTLRRKSLLSSRRRHKPVTRLRKHRHEMPGLKYEPSLLFTEKFGLVKVTQLAGKSPDAVD